MQCCGGLKEISWWQIPFAGSVGGRRPHQRHQQNGGQAGGETERRRAGHSEAEAEAAQQQVGFTSLLATVVSPRVLAAVTPALL